jgi:acyl transferase domain-containing protein
VNEPIAVVGLGCVLPDAVSPEAFWANTLAKRSSVRPLEGSEWTWRLYSDADPNVSDCLPTLNGARVDGYAFDWRRFRMPPAEVEQTNPMALMVLDAGSQCLETVRTIPKDTTGVFIGATSLGYRKDTGLRLRLPDLVGAAEASPTLGQLPPDQRTRILDSAKAALCSRLRPVTEDTAINTPASVAAGRIAMRFDLRGLHYAVDASFASGLAALDIAIRSLREGTLDMTLAGAASEPLSPLEMLAFARLGLLGQRRVASFDASADGTLLGEGAVMLALKRLSTARRDGDTIYALIRGVAGSTDNADGHLGEPTIDGRVAAMRRAYLDGDVDPETIAFVECDAPGVPNSDRAEVAALARLHSGRATGSLALGSAKPTVGHLRAAAAGVGLLRAVLALQYATLPPQTNFHTPHPELALDTSLFYIPPEPVAFTSRGGDPIRASVNAFGLGGLSYHAVLERFEPAMRFTSAATKISAEPIAIVGMGAWVPGARSVAELQDLLLNGRDMSGTVPFDRWPADRYYDPDRRRSETIYTKLGCFADAPPDESQDEGIDPGQLMILRAAEEALSDAEFDRRHWNSRRIAVSLGLMPFLGRRFLADMRMSWREFEAELAAAMRSAGMDDVHITSATREAESNFKASLPPITRDSVLGWLGSIHAGRLASTLGFRGVSFTIDSACASTHAALHAAIQALRHRTCDVALAGGVCSDLQPEYFVACCRFSALSATGITPFDAAADGFIPGEGAGVLVLRRLADAVKAGERIHAVIRSIAGSSDGRGRSVLAPRSEGEALAMERALHAADIDAGLVDYVECHGAGTAVGDVAEVEACTFAYGRGRTRPLRIGSVKSNLGHLNGAAGAPAVIKATLAVRDGVIPASLKTVQPNPRIDFAAGPVEVVNANQTWSTAEGQPRRAGVSAFGLGGSNFHLIIEQYRPRSCTR